MSLYIYSVSLYSIRFRHLFSFLSFQLAKVRFFRDLCNKVCVFCYIFRFTQSFTQSFIPSFHNLFTIFSHHPSSCKHLPYYPFVLSGLLAPFALFALFVPLVPFVLLAPFVLLPILPICSIVFRFIMS